MYISLKTYFRENEGASQQYMIKEISMDLKYSTGHGVEKVDT